MDVDDERIASLGTRGDRRERRGLDQAEMVLILAASTLLHVLRVIDMVIPLSRTMHRRRK
jgi:hypothetical protein